MTGLITRSCFLLALSLGVPAWGARYVATSPQTTELLFQMGLGPDIVGAVEGSNYPPEASAIASVGRLFSLSLEKTIALHPDLVILDTHTLNPAFKAALDSLGVPSFVWNTFSPDSLLQDARRLAAHIERPLPTRFGRWEACLSALDERPQATAKSAIVFVWLDPPIVVGSGAFLAQLFRKLGYENAVLPALHIPYVPVTLEWLVGTKPDQVFYLRHPSESDAVSRAHFARWWPASTPPAHALEADRFARASLTALENIGRLPSVEGTALPETCRRE